MLCQASDGIVHPLPSFPRKAGIQTCRHGNLSDKTVSSTLRSRFPLLRE
ncbi:hypothetical protein NMH_2244 [Neisseria meningitidis H44/76]|uniref:Uncharacterized protein n=1 Tax=Neisseria meningitidis serogroup B / serotype 15 (strain H44/76) TaxID=909420 RepID=E6N063_NEIMH|nr:hypothetical protein NMH_2244 [Neisseria meningitidis H44/76]